jgi:hypothetical protein
MSRESTPRAPQTVTMTTERFEELHMAEQMKEHYRRMADALGAENHRLKKQLQILIKNK